MEELKLMVPTYNGKWLKEPNCTLDDFGEPEVPVLVCSAEGVKIVLGSHDCHDCTKPDVQIERRHNGWMIFLHPLAGSDPSGLVVFLDDGRSFIAKDSDYGPTESIEMVEYEEAIAELDDVLPSGLSCSPTMIVQVPPVHNAMDYRQRELTDGPSARPLEHAQLPISRTLIDAFKSAKEALAGDSNDQEHDALLALVEALEGCDLDE